MRKDYHDIMPNVYDVGWCYKMKQSMYVTYKSFDEKQDAINAVKSRWWDNHPKYQKLLASLNNNNNVNVHVYNCLI